MIGPDGVPQKGDHIQIVENNKCTGITYVDKTTYDYGAGMFEVLDDGGELRTVSRSYALEAATGIRPIWVHLVRDDNPERSP